MLLLWKHSKTWILRIQSTLIYRWGSLIWDSSMLHIFRGCHEFLTSILLLHYRHVILNVIVCTSSNNLRLRSRWRRRWSEEFWASSTVIKRNSYSVRFAIKKHRSDRHRDKKHILRSCQENFTLGYLRLLSALPFGFISYIVFAYLFLRIDNIQQGHLTLYTGLDST